MVGIFLNAELFDDIWLTGKMVFNIRLVCLIGDIVFGFFFNLFLVFYLEIIIDLL